MLTETIDNILVEKANRKMHLRHGDKIVKTYKISLGKNPVGAKVKSGDNKTPEGKYYIVKHNPKSAFHLSLKISYPNEEQIKTAKDGGYDPGGDIMIHGYPNKIPAFLFRFWHKRKDWTAGCIAVTNDEIEEIYDIVKDGTPITILPPKTELRENQIKPICLNDFKNGMERLDVRDFHKKKIWHGFEYFKTDTNTPTLKKSLKK